ncbi:MAG: DnaJ C-terminal domain-containing protein [Burkholderiaceae bacterium]
MEFDDYYQILGVPRGATQEEIRRAYRKLARRYHPDLSREPGSEARFKMIAEAYEVLHDPHKRASYDQRGARWHAAREFRSAPNWDDAPYGGAGRNPAVDDLGDFGRARHHPRQRGFQASGRDCHARVSIDLETAVHGATSSFKLRLPARDHAGHPITRERVVNVQIPPGIRPGQQLRLAGQGEPGAGGGAAGDLYLEIQFNPHPMYRVEGCDLYVTLPVAPWEAALGAAVRAPTPNGVVEVTIAAGSQGGKKLRLRGRGLPGSPPGDLYMVLELVLPPADSERARELYRTMARELSFNPRRSLGV